MVVRDEQIKSGAPCRSERLCKYNEIMRIEEELLRENKRVFYGDREVESYLWSVWKKHVTNPWERLF